METMEVTIGQYADYFSNWFGLKDGTLLAVDDDRGDWWVKSGKRVMTAEEFNNA